MQLRRSGIPCNVPRRYNPQAKEKVVVKHKQIVKITQQKHFTEMTRYVDGLEQSVIGPVGTKQHRQAIKDGYETVCDWTVN